MAHSLGFKASSDIYSTFLPFVTDKVATPRALISAPASAIYSPHEALSDAAPPQLLQRCGAVSSCHYQQQFVFRELPANLKHVSVQP